MMGARTVVVYVVLYLLSILVSSFGLWRLGQNYLVPWMKAVKYLWGLSDGFAAATILAIGGAAPELFISLFSTMFGNASIGFGVIMGSSMMSFGLVPVVLFFGREKSFELRFGPVARGTLFYLVGLAAATLIMFAGDGKIGLIKSIYLILVYVLYLATVLLLPGESTVDDDDGGFDGALMFPTWARPNDLIQGDEHDYFLPTREELEPLNVEASVSPKSTMQKPPSKEETSILIADCLSFSFDVFFGWTIPSPPRAMPQLDVPSGHLATIGVFASMTWLGVLSGVMYGATSGLCYLFPDYLSGAAAGAVILAAGTGLPDILAATSLAKAGMYNMGIRKMIASQIALIALGLGVPWLLMMAENGRSVPLAFDNGTKYTWISLLCLSGFSAIIFLGVLFSGRFSGDASINKNGAAALACGFVFTQATIITIEFET